MVTRNFHHELTGSVTNQLQMSLYCQIVLKCQTHYLLVCGVSFSFNELDISFHISTLSATAASAAALVPARVLQEQLLQLQGRRVGIWHRAVGDADVW